MTKKCDNCKKNAKKRAKPLAKAPLVCYTNACVVFCTVENNPFAYAKNCESDDKKAHGERKRR